MALVVNSRITLLAYGPKGRETALDGYNSTLFGKDAARNSAVIAMMNGEVYCDKLVATGKTSEGRKTRRRLYLPWFNSS